MITTGGADVRFLILDCRISNLHIQKASINDEAGSVGGVVSLALHVRNRNPRAATAVIIVVCHKREREREGEDGCFYSPSC
ncbi:hypothetical protein CsSME_00010213 [Camellia sinensis var. sinensis]